MKPPLIAENGAQAQRHDPNYISTDARPGTHVDGKTRAFNSN
jgi:hypothetical protein